MEEQLLGVLLPVGAELVMTSAYQLPQHHRPHTRPASLVIEDSLLSLHAVLAGGHRLTQLGKLKLEVTCWVLEVAPVKPLRPAIELPKFWQSVEHLEDAVHVASVAEVVEARIVWPPHGQQFAPTLGQDCPLPDSLVHVNFQLNHALISFLHVCHLNAEVLQMFFQVGIKDHVVLLVTKDIRFPVPRDGAELDRKRPTTASLLIVIHSVIVASSPVKEAAATGDDSVSEI